MRKSGIIVAVPDAAHGQTFLAYATLQEGMEYFIDEAGYIAYTTVQHPGFLSQA